jgi:DNA helicase-2/ATP-dependent DNA helicase PcrA
VGITQAQGQAADQQQQSAAGDTASHIRLIAGPGTGKSKTIEKRVALILATGVAPSTVHVISFTRATCRELRERISGYCRNLPCAQAATQIRVSTMHALAFRILRSAGVIGQLFPDEPTVLDKWEEGVIYDPEFSATAGCPPSRAEEIRLAHDAAWQTLNPQEISQRAVTPAEEHSFTSFHATRRHLYCCVLPGELIFRCVEAIRLGSITAQHMPAIAHLVVDEYQDLNACDQEFIHLLTTRAGATLFVAGDDDQSIYSFRHADPSGLVNFPMRYPGASTHILTDCFRCPPAVLNPALRMIAVNPNRVAKPLVALNGQATPPVNGTLHVWSFPDPTQEAMAIASSCQALLAAGLPGAENDIVILISDRALQLPLLTQALTNLGLAYEPPPADRLTDVEGIRAVYTFLRIVRAQRESAPDYVAMRTLLTLLSGVGTTTAKQVGDECINHNENFHRLFLAGGAPHWLSARPATAVQRVKAIVSALGGWDLQDTLQSRRADLDTLLQQHVFPTSAKVAVRLAEWNDLAAGLPQGMFLSEFFEFLSADTEADQRSIREAVEARINPATTSGSPSATPRIRILTMHGAKGLSGKVVFIPGLNQGIMPSDKAMQATGLLIEARRLFYVSLTRAQAACIVSHAVRFVGAIALRLRQQYAINLTRSNFLTEMGATSLSRTTGLGAAEAASIVADVRNL